MVPAARIDDIGSQSYLVTHYVTYASQNHVGASKKPGSAIREIVALPRQRFERRARKILRDTATIAPHIRHANSALASASSGSQDGNAEIFKHALSKSLWKLKQKIMTMRSFVSEVGCGIVEYRKLRCKKAAIAFQSQFRGWLTRSRAKTQERKHAAITHTQSAVRGYMTREKNRKLNLWF